MTLTLGVLIGFWDGASPAPAPASVQSAYPGGIFAWFDGASPAPEAEGGFAVYIPVWRPRRR